jgi:hypothetical protein
VLPTPLREESLSLAYIQAVAGMCGLIWSRPQHDLGIDMTLDMVAERNGRFGPLGFKLDIQAKSTTDFVRTEREVKYDLLRKNYDDLRDTSVGTPRILVLLLLPDNESDWLVTTEAALVLRHCAYWLSLKGSPPTANTETVRITLPRSNLFTVQTLQSMMEASLAVRHAAAR